ncbi:hypothetical protein [Streptomyces canus]|uniref:hypothetical protein n=1 Tax=Streptomyces canus TaxID=58343 RepID=UPI00324D8A73
MFPKALGESKTFGPALSQIDGFASVAGLLGPAGADVVLVMAPMPWGLPGRPAVTEEVAALRAGGASASPPDDESATAAGGNPLDLSRRVRFPKGA